MIGDADLLARIERTYDAIPRRPGVRVEAVGPFELFVREGAGWPFYARPRLGVRTFTTTDVDSVLARQRRLQIPEAIEWVEEITPDLLAAIPARLPVRHAPLMVLDPARLSTTGEATEAAVVVLDLVAPDFAELFALSAAVAAVGFAHPATAVGTAGPAERDAALRPSPPNLLSEVTAARRVDAVAVDPVDGIVARATYQYALGAAEVVGVATLPSARRRGYAAALTAVLARHALAAGNDLVFLSAAHEVVAGMYAGIGFRRIGTAGIAEVG